MKLSDANILVLDDEVELCELCAEWLVAAGTHKVFTADEAKDALTVLLSESIDLLLTDVRMPGMDGLELQRRIRLERPTLPIIFISAHENAETRQAALNEGAFNFLYKPFDAADLLEKIDAALTTVQK